MAVTHYEIDGKIVCGTKAKKIISSSNKEEVTCKRCKAKISKSIEGTVKVEMDRKKVVLHFNRCIMTFPLHEFDHFNFSSVDGRHSFGTSIGMKCHQIKSCLKEKDKQFFVDAFKKIEFASGLTGQNVYEYFKG